jgi:hypothetical protein
MTDSVWEAEERFWTAGVDHYEVAMHPHCVMAFAQPAGILSGPSILATIRQAPRWRSVSMTERQESRPSAEIVVIAYEADARLEDGGTYRATCTSTYVAEAGRWRLVQHQQTPH